MYVYVEMSQQNKTMPVLPPIVLGVFSPTYGVVSSTIKQGIRHGLQ